MKRVERNGIPCFQFGHLRETAGLRHAIFTRSGGVSTGPFHSLNVGLGIGDREENVWKNRDAISNCMDATALVSLNQTHGVGIFVASGENVGALPENRRADAAISLTPGLFLLIQTADCQSVLLCDPIRRVVANVHSGWRGSVADIIGGTILRMESEFGCRPSDLIAGIAPSLGPCCAEFVHYKDEIPPHLWQYRMNGNRFDFWSMSVDQMTAKGVLHENIQVSGLCTRCRTDLFFSYRAEGTTGRFASVIGWSDR